MIVVVILAVWAALVSAVAGLILGTLFWGASLVMPPAVIFGALGSLFAFPFVYIFFAASLMSTRHGFSG